MDGGQHPASASHVVDVSLGVVVVVCLDEQDLVLKLMGCPLQSEAVSSLQLELFRDSRLLKKPRA